MNVLNYICFLFVILIINSCANTRVVVEGVKTVINENKRIEEKSVKKENKKNNYVQGH